MKIFIILVGLALIVQMIFALALCRAASMRPPRKRMSSEMLKSILH